MELAEVVEIFKSGKPEEWPKTRGNKEKVNGIARFLQDVTGEYVECSWCNKEAIFKHVRKWLVGHGHL
jgi:hypothetical protein